MEKIGFIDFGHITLGVVRYVGKSSLGLRSETLISPPGAVSRATPDTAAPVHDPRADDIVHLVVRSPDAVTSYLNVLSG